MNILFLSISKNSPVFFVELYVYMYIYVIYTLMLITHVETFILKFSLCKKTCEFLRKSNEKVIAPIVYKKCTKIKF